MPNQPIVPRSLTNPIGQTERINRTTAAIVNSLDNTESWLLARFKEIPVKEIVVSRFWVNKSRYEYQISIPDLERLVLELQIELGRVPDDYVVQQTIGAYEIGTDLAVTNLANLTDDYTRNITQVLLSEPWQRRVALVGARVFEEMEGFEGDAGVRLSRILRQAVQDGLPPSSVVESLQDAFGISRRRAKTISQTEITGALRRGRWDEAQDANDRLGIRVGLLWISALKPTTRLWHATRHGSIFTIQAVREFYAVDGNAIHCYCSQTEILLDKDGKPVTPRVVLRLKKQKDQYFGE
jgi:hypothetical protein